MRQQVKRNLVCIISVVITVVLLASCQTATNLHKIEETTYLVQRHPHIKPLCRICNQGILSTYSFPDETKSPDENQSQILVCEKCSSVWITPVRNQVGESIQ